MKDKNEKILLKKNQQKVIDEIMKKDSITLSFPITKKQKKNKSRDIR